MIRWNEQRLEELVRIMKLRRTPGQGKLPIHLSLYGSSRNSEPLLTKIMQLNANAWSYTETDRVSVVRYLGTLGCKADGALSKAVLCQRPLSLDLAGALADAGARDEDTLSIATRYQHPLTLELAKLLIDASAFNKSALRTAAMYQQPLTLELAQLLIDAGAFDEEALGYAAQYQRLLTPELAKLLIDAGAFDKSVLSIAAQWQHPLSLELTKFLIHAGAFDKKSLSWAAIYQQPLTLELAKTLIDAGTFNKWSLPNAAQYQNPLTFELAKMLINAGCDPAVQGSDGWDALVSLAVGGRPADPQVTDLFLSAGCRTDLDGCKAIFDEHRTRFDQILKEHARWKEPRERVAVENAPTVFPSNLDWGK